MLFRIFYYFYNIIRQRSPVFVMNLLVRDEVDLIEANIRYHYSIGISQFNVIDNGSTDGTLEVLRELALDIPINIISKPFEVYSQQEWMTELNFIARRQGASMVFNNDADEFYILRNESTLIELFSVSDSVVFVNRYNVLLESGKCWFNSSYVVKNPVFIDREAQKSIESVSMPLVKIQRKVITNPWGIKCVGGGNHTARHVAKKFTSRLEERIFIAHYPFQSWEKFRKNIEHRKELVSQGAKMGPHYHRWVAKLKSGELLNEYNAIVMQDSELAVLEKVGIVEQDNSIPMALKEFISS